jgi:hypothetical protein
VKVENIKRYVTGKDFPVIEYDIREFVELFMQTIRKEYLSKNS